MTRRSPAGPSLSWPRTRTTNRSGPADCWPGCTPSAPRSACCCARRGKDRTPARQPRRRNSSQRSACRSSATPWNAFPGAGTWSGSVWACRTDNSPGTGSRDPCRGPRRGGGRVRARRRRDRSRGALPLRWTHRPRRPRVRCRRAQRRGGLRAARIPHLVLVVGGTTDLAGRAWRGWFRLPLRPAELRAKAAAMAAYTSQVRAVLRAAGRRGAPAPGLPGALRTVLGDVRLAASGRRNRRRRVRRR